MIILPSSLPESFLPQQDPYEQDILVTRQARKLYERACRRGQLNRLWQFINGRLERLPNLVTLGITRNIYTCHSLGVQKVLIRRIRGSEDRGAGFDAQFYPYREHRPDRWVSIAAARKMGMTLPPVRLIQVGTSYFVRDGHYRISVARALGEQSIEAEIIAWEVKRDLPWNRATVAQPALPQPAVVYDC